MAAAIGADVEQLRALAKRFTASADKLQRSSSGLTNFVGNATYWRGIDADRFRTEWRSQSSPSITAAINSLRTASAALVTNADEQDQASAARGAATSATDCLVPDGMNLAPSPTDPPDPGVVIKPPANTEDLWNNLKEFEKIKDNTSGYFVQKIEKDGEISYVVYIVGTDAADGQTKLSNVPAAFGKLDDGIMNQLKKLIDPPGAPVMLVGHSQGGMDAQNIAKSGVLNNVQQVVTFGSPTRDDPTVPTVHMRESNDLVPFEPDAAAVGVGLLGPLGEFIADKSPYSHSLPNEMQEEVAHLGSTKDEYFTHDVKGTDSTGDAHQDYGGVARAYDKQLDAGKENVQNLEMFFNGDSGGSRGSYIDTNGDARKYVITSR